MFNTYENVKDRVLADLGRRDSEVSVGPHNQSAEQEGEEDENPTAKDTDLLNDEDEEEDYECDDYTYEEVYDDYEPSAGNITAR